MTNNSSRRDFDPSAGRQEIITKTTWIVLAVAINAFEFFIPRIPFFPWLKPGLANCVTIIWIMEFGVVDALLYSLVRIWIVGFYFGFSFLTITLGLSGAIVSTITMGAAWALLGKRGALGTMGIGVIGALAHNATQIVVIYFLLAKNTHVFYQVPAMLAASVAFGSITGALAPSLLGFLRQKRRGISIEGPINRLPEATITAGQALLVAALLALSCAIVCIDSAFVLAVAALAATACLLFARGGSPRIAASPITNYWLLFVFIACVDLFDSYGTKVEALPFLTVEGVRSALLQGLRLWTWIELASMLTLLNFHAVAIRALRRFFPGHRPTLFAAMLSLEYFPSVVRAVQRKGKGRLLRLLRHPVTTLRAGLNRVFEEVNDLLDVSSK